MNIPCFAQIKEPKVLCLLTANGGGTKLFQSYLDGHSAFYNIPAYPLLYFYPHWDAWCKELAHNWNWDSLINKFCEKHASVLDSRKISGFNGLDSLGENKDQHIEIDENQFRSYMQQILAGEALERRTFLLAINYAYALCKGEDLSGKTVFLWHHHVYEYLSEFWADFPDAILFGLVRDARPRVFRAYDAMLKMDEGKLSEADCLLYRSSVYFNATFHTFWDLGRLASYPQFNQMYLVRHEDLKLKLEAVMRKVCAVLNVRFEDMILETTFDGKYWWGHAIYNMPQVTGTYERVISKDWQTSLGNTLILVYEGIFLPFYQQCHYDLLHYKKDTLANLLKLTGCILLPQTIEISDAALYFKPATHLKFIQLTCKEASGEIPLRDYSWNATYLYKWLYTERKLWQYPWYRRCLEAAWKYLKANPKDLGARLFLNVAGGMYVTMRYLRFLVEILTLPLRYMQRVGMYYVLLFKRLTGKLSLPILIE